VRGKQCFSPPQGEKERVGEMERGGEVGSDAGEVPLH